VDVTEQIQRGDLRVLQLWQGQTPESLGDPNRERRTMPRAAVSFSASLRWRDRVLDGIVENLGAEGLFVQVEDPPEVGTEVEIEWELPADFAPVSVRARVMPVGCLRQCRRTAVACRAQPGGAFEIRATSSSRVQTPRSTSNVSNLRRTSSSRASKPSSCCRRVPRD